MVKRSIVAAETGAATRQERRSTLGSLTSLRVGERAAAKYRLAAKRFLVWARTEEHDAETLRDVDVVLCLYTETLWENGAAKADAGDVLSGVQHFLYTRRAFHGAWTLFGAWAKTELPNRAPPLPAAIARALAGLGIAMDRRDIAALICVGFHCMLRSEEKLSASWNAISLDSDGGEATRLTFGLVLFW